MNQKGQHEKQTCNPKCADKGTMHLSSQDHGEENELNRQTNSTASTAAKLTVWSCRAPCKQYLGQLYNPQPEYQHTNFTAMKTCCSLTRQKQTTKQCLQYDLNSLTEMHAQSNTQDVHELITEAVSATTKEF